MNDSRCIPPPPVVAPPVVSPLRSTQNVEPIDDIQGSAPGGLSGIAFGCVGVLIGLGLGFFAWHQSEPPTQLASTTAQHAPAKPQPPEPPTPVSQMQTQTAELQPANNELASEIQFVASTTATEYVEEIPEQAEAGSQQSLDHQPIATVYTHEDVDPFAIHASPEPLLVSSVVSPVVSQPKETTLVSAALPKAMPVAGSSPLKTLADISAAGNSTTCADGTCPTSNLASLDTTLQWTDTPADAYKLAKEQNKLVFLIHVSGNFKIPGFT